MAAKPLPSQEGLRQLLDYDPETGTLTWRVRSVVWFPAKTANRSKALCDLWNDRYAGKEAFTHVSDGYRIGSISAILYKAHRVIWKRETGEDAVQIDHIDGDRCNNRFENLRNVSLIENARNRRRPSGNRSGVMGVYEWAHNGFRYWVSAVPGQKATYHKSFDDAVAARKRAEAEHGFHANHGRAA